MDTDNNLHKLNEGKRAESDDELIMKMCRSYEIDIAMIDWGNKSAIFISNFFIYNGFIDAKQKYIMRYGDVFIDDSTYQKRETEKRINIAVGLIDPNTESFYSDNRHTSNRRGGGTNVIHVGGPVIVDPGNNS